MTHLNGGLIQQGKKPVVKHLAQVLAGDERESF
jgi:hypothetical protein